jgi:hypothetical protein
MGRTWLLLLRTGISEHTEYEAQQTGQSISRDRPDNLFEPVEGDCAAHGIFSEISKDYSLQNWINLRRTPIALTAAGLAGLGALTWRARRRFRRSR